MKERIDLMPYDEIREIWFRLNKQALFVSIGMICYMSVFLIGIVLSLFGYLTFPQQVNGLTIGSAWLMAAVFIYAFYKYDWISKIESQRYREIENSITPELEEIARTWYGDDWHKALRECIEAHFPGDCPLCGAT